MHSMNSEEPLSSCIDFVLLGEFISKLRIQLGFYGYPAVENSPCFGIGKQINENKGHDERCMRRNLEETIS